MFTIPGQFSLGGRLVTIQIEDDMMAEEDLLGQAVYRQGLIRLQAVTPKHTQDAQTQTFCHELIHWLFYSAGRSNLNDDEALVDVLGTFLHQFMVTQAGEPKG